MQLDGALVVQLIDVGKRRGHGGGAFERAGGVERRDAGGHETRELLVERRDANLLAFVAAESDAQVPPQGALREGRRGSGDDGAERDTRNVDDVACRKRAAFLEPLVGIVAYFARDRARVHDVAVA